MSDTEVLTCLSDGGLNALATAKLVPLDQARLNQLLDQSKQGTLTTFEASELDALLNQVEELNLLKARARYTLKASSGGIDR